jgi:hypothetical protein
VAAQTSKALATSLRLHAAPCCTRRARARSPTRALASLQALAIRTAGTSACEGKQAARCAQSSGCSWASCTGWGLGRSAPSCTLSSPAFALLPNAPARRCALAASGRRAPECDMAPSSKPPRRRIVPELISPSQAARAAEAFAAATTAPAPAKAPPDAGKPLSLREQAGFADAHLGPGRRIYVEIGPNSFEVNWKKVRQCEHLDVLPLSLALAHSLIRSSERVGLCGFQNAARWCLTTSSVVQALVQAARAAPASVQTRPLLGLGKCTPPAAKQLEVKSESGTARPRSCSRSEASASSRGWLRARPRRRLAPPAACSRCGTCTGLEQRYTWLLHRLLQPSGALALHPRGGSRRQAASAVAPSRKQSRPSVE